MRPRDCFVSMHVRRDLDPEGSIENVPRGRCNSGFNRRPQIQLRLRHENRPEQHARCRTHCELELFRRCHRSCRLRERMPTAVLRTIARSHLAGHRATRPHAVHGHGASGSSTPCSRLPRRANRPKRAELRVSQSQGPQRIGRAVSSVVSSKLEDGLRTGLCAGSH